jgi:thioredoxin reductase (NADPH)
VYPRLRFRGHRSSRNVDFLPWPRETDMFVVLEGTVNIYTGDEKNDIEPVIDLTHYQFTGELNMLNDQRTLVGARTTVDSVLLRVTRDNLQRLMRAERSYGAESVWRRRPEPASS